VSTAKTDVSPSCGAGGYVRPRRGIADLKKRTVTTLSGGQRRCLDVAMGLRHRPPLLFLDELSTGLDPQNRANLWEHMLKPRGQSSLLVGRALKELPRWWRRPRWST
jgi:energy-coupling factor transporter ATP-binding protein EcfA2